MAEEESQPLKVDPRRAKNDGMTGIFVRAVTRKGEAGPHDIAELDRKSLIRWLNPEGNLLQATNVVLIFLGHAPEVSGGD